MVALLYYFWTLFLRQVDSPAGFYYNVRGKAKRGCGAVGSASEWHSEGQGFESPQLHYFYNIDASLSPTDYSYRVLNRAFCFS